MPFIFCGTSRSVGHRVNANTFSRGDIRPPYDRHNAAINPRRAPVPTPVGKQVGVELTKEISEDYNFLRRSTATGGRTLLMGRLSSDQGNGCVGSR